MLQRKLDRIVAGSIRYPIDDALEMIPLQTAKRTNTGKYAVIVDRIRSWHVGLSCVNLTHESAVDFPLASSMLLSIAVRQRH